MIPHTHSPDQQQPPANEATEQALALNKDTLQDLDAENADAVRGGLGTATTRTITTVTITLTTWKETNAG